MLSLFTYLQHLINKVFYPMLTILTFLKGKIMKKIISLSILAMAISNTALAGNYLYNVSGKFNKSKVEKAVSSTGGTVVDCLPQIGVCQVAYDSVEQALNSGLSVIPDASVYQPKLQADLPYVQLDAVAEEYSNPPNSADDDFFFDLQWGHDAVNAVESWNAGNRGAGVRVAVLDSGADAAHPDLMPNINTGLSASFVAGEAWDDYNGNTFNHGTHTAGTIAAADNGYGTIGVAPEAELVILKVLSAVTGSGSSYGTMAAMVYAADNGVDVANMSLGLSIRKNGLYDVEGTPYDTSDDIRFDVGGKDGIAQFINTYSKAATYARQNGVTLIASAGNESTDYDKTDSLMHLPSSLPAVLSISATGPINWGSDPYTNLDNRAIYTNYGQSTIDFAAPGGDYTSAFLPGGYDDCTVGGITRPCYVFDFVFSTGGNGGWYWSVGTSMAAPHATGVAALIIGANGGDMSPAKVERELRRWSEDLGKPGNDDTFGHGRVAAPQ